MPFPDSEVPTNSEESAVKTEIGEMQTDREELAVDLLLYLPSSVRATFYKTECVCWYCMYALIY